MKIKNKLNKIPGIYKITNLYNNKIYIGSSGNIYHRYHNHLSKLKKNIHCNPHLQSAWNKYGEENFNIEILAMAPKEYLIKLEQWFIDNLHPEYNIREEASSNRGCKITESKIRRGWHHSDIKIKISKANKGRKSTQETKRKISETNKGKYKNYSIEYRNKIGERFKKTNIGKTPWNKGIPCSNVTKSKLSKSIKKSHKEGKHLKRIFAKYKKEYSVFENDKLILNGNIDFILSNFPGKTKISLQSALSVGCKWLRKYKIQVKYLEEFIY